MSMIATHLARPFGNCHPELIKITPTGGNPFWLVQSGRNDGRYINLKGFYCDTPEEAELQWNQAYGKVIRQAVEL